MRGRDFLLHPAAIEEATLSAQWYRERNPETAKRFVDEVNRALDRILKAPTRWPRGFGGTRRVSLPCFPFVIIYRESETQILLVAVAHGRRDPAYWRHRL